MFPVQRRLAAAILFLTGLGRLDAQDVKFSGVVQVWYTQMLDSNLRLNGSPSLNGGKGYYDLRTEFRENGFTARRVQFQAAGRIVDGVEYSLMIDPAINTSATNPTILQDAIILLKPAKGLEFKLGQFKNHQSYEGMISSADLPFVNGSQLGRMFGEKRDRGVLGSYAFGDPKAFAARVCLGVFNGMSDAIGGKGADTNAQKDLVARVECTLAKVHQFGAYTLQGGTDVADKTGAAIAPAKPGTGWPTQADVHANRDKTTNLGAWYVYQDKGWQVAAEYMTGLLGRRYATLAASAPAVKREHLDQQFTSYNLTGGYTFGAHTLLARYDLMDFNSGSQWYTGWNPYTSDATGKATGLDYTPKYTEITLGYTFAWKPEKVKAANIRVNYIARSKNFLAPNTAGGQTREQGGDSLAVAFQVAF